MIAFLMSVDLLHKDKRAQVSLLNIRARRTLNDCTDVCVYVVMSVRGEAFRYIECNIRNDCTRHLKEGISKFKRL